LDFPSFFIAVLKRQLKKAIYQMIFQTKNILIRQKLFIF